MENFSDRAFENAKKIKILALDVDGVMTDGSITYDENGVEYKTFNVKDGQGLVRMQKSGFITAIITARNNGTVQHRAENLNITELYQGRKDKLPALEEILRKYNLTHENVAYMGDDLPDICILEKVGLSCCPKDAVKEVADICIFKSSYNGGRGAVRELCDFILEAQNIEKIRSVAEGKSR
ncbi:MAG: HAD hydrolase family protein [bacterium]|nr:HAD hydrolase family protein [bacterium]